MKKLYKEFEKCQKIFKLHSDYSFKDWMLAYLSYIVYLNNRFGVEFREENGCYFKRYVKYVCTSLEWDEKKKQYAKFPQVYNKEESARWGWQIREMKRLYPHIIYK